MQIFPGQVTGYCDELWDFAADTKKYEKKF